MIGHKLELACLAQRHGADVKSSADSRLHAWHKPTLKARHLHDCVECLSLRHDASHGAHVTGTYRLAVLHLRVCQLQRRLRPASGTTSQLRWPRMLGERMQRIHCWRPTHCCAFSSLFRAPCGSQKKPLRHVTKCAP